MTFGYSNEPQNLTLADVDQRIRQQVQSQKLYGDYVPRSIPQIAVDVPLVEFLPGNPYDGSEVNLRVGDGNQIARMLYLRSLPGWVQIGQPPRVTTLPTTPFDGMQVVYVADDTNGVEWQFSYNEAGTEWRFIGGPPLYAEVLANETETATSFDPLTTAGPTITLPLAGDYDVEIGCDLWNNTAGEAALMSYDIGVTPAVDADAVVHQEPAGDSLSPTTVTRKRRKTGLTAVALTAKYRATGGTASFQNRSISVTPVRI